MTLQKKNTFLGKKIFLIFEYYSESFKKSQLGRNKNVHDAP